MAASRMPFYDLAGLAAVHAALDPARHEWRSDILISSIIEILSSNKQLSERALHREIKNLWITNAVDAAMLRVALGRAENELLVERRQRGRDIRWAVTPASASDASSDKNSVRTLLARFDQDARQRLRELLEEPKILDSFPLSHLTDYLIGAFIAGSHRVFRGVTQTSDPASLDSIDFDHSAVRKHLQKLVKTERIAEVLIALARAAADPTDPFGTELLRLIVTGQVLHGMLTRRDLPQPTSVAGSLLLLDTSALVYQLGCTGPQPQLLREFIQESANAHCDVAVTRAVIDEWGLLWRRASEGAETLANASTGLPSQFGKYAQNPVLRCWLSEAEDGRSQTWADFQRKNGQIEPWLAARGVRVIEAGEADADLVEKIRAELVRLSDAAPSPKRTPAAARTDAYSAALVAEERARKAAPIPSAWFIAQDRLSNKAYLEIQTRDRFPICSAVETWLLLLSATRTDDPARTRDLAEIVGDSAVLNSFLTVSAGYEVDELVDIASVLMPDPTATVDELTAVVRTDYLTLANLSGTDVPAGLLRRRAIHRDRQVQRGTERLDAMRKDFEDKEQKLKDKEQKLEDSERQWLADRGKLEADKRRLQRAFWLVAALAVIAASILGSALAGVPFWIVVTEAFGGVAFGCEGARWVTKLAVTAHEFILAMAATLAWTVLGSILGLVLSQSTNAHPAPRPVPSIAPSAVRAADQSVMWPSRRLY